MKKFVVSDLHGDGIIYQTIMNYMDFLSLKEEVEFFINGDLIDRGSSSTKMLLDIKRRIEEERYPITYLAGNHELMMFEIYDKRRKGIMVRENDWYNNGGFITDLELTDTLQTKDKILEVVDFISHLKIYHKFSEKIQNKNIVLAHAACPLLVKEECDLYLGSDNDNKEYLLWARENDPYIPFKCRIGNPNYFSILGHTPNQNPFGYEYHKDGNYINIDGGCAYYVLGEKEMDHVPLIEIQEDSLRILTLNHNQELLSGSYFRDKKVEMFSLEEFQEEQKTFQKIKCKEGMK